MRTCSKATSVALLVGALAAVSAHADEPSCPPVYAEVLCRSGAFRPEHRRGGGDDAVALPLAPGDFSNPWDAPAKPLPSRQRPVPEPMLPLPAAGVLDPRSADCLLDPECRLWTLTGEHRASFVEHCRAGNRLACRRLEADRELILDRLGVPSPPVR